MQLMSKNELENGENMFEVTLSQALGVNASKESNVDSTKLSRVSIQLIDALHCTSFNYRINC